MFGHSSLWVYPSEICWASWICKLISVTKFGKFWSLFLQIFFPAISFFSLYEIPVTYMVDLWVGFFFFFFYRFLRLFTFFNLFFCFSDWVISTDLSCTSHYSDSRACPLGKVTVVKNKQNWKLTPTRRVVSPSFDSCPSSSVVFFVFFSNGFDLFILLIGSKHGL